MKTNNNARQVSTIRQWAGLLAVLTLVSVELCMVCQFGRVSGQFSAQPCIQAPGLGDLLAAR
ncbi:MAG: hypothetical protein NT154_31260 [Verrucomicrobia bacterium]|nr:hypothetical protein [Verrucomicrobiota bacterium]